MPRSYIDHLVVTASALEIGAEFVQKTLGVRLQPGGEHARMGTHNLLLRLGEALYLEVIAPNPHAPRPTRPRWFGLDAGPADAAPRLASWVARVGDIHAAAGACSEPLGAVEPMSRGALEWLITLPADGGIALDGIAPALIEWRGEPHPASRLKDLGLSLAKLELFHPNPERVSRLLSSLGLEGPICVSALAAGVAPRLAAQIQTPDGVRELPPA
jgi:hypothetical protein